MAQPNTVAVCLCSCAAWLLAPLTVSAQALATRAVATGLSEPLFVTAAPGDASRVFVVERLGRVKIIKTDGWTVLPTPYLDMSASVIQTDDNAGLLSIAFDPAYATTGYVYTSSISPDISTVITRHQVSANPDVVNPASATMIWKFARPQGHYGGYLGFSPTDGFLYLSSGDGGIFNSLDSAMRAQDITSQLMGKILRINPASDAFPGDANRNYSIPAGNPFVGVTGDDEIWAYGLRNPWRCGFDRATGDFWVADVGQDAWEEINHQPAAGGGGRNYGWRCMEAQTCTGLSGCTCNGPTLTLPLHSYDHSLGVSVTGGYVYRGSLIPALQGAYVFGDFVSARVWSFFRSGSMVTQLTERTADLTPPPPVTLASIASFGEDSQGELYMCEYFGGALLKIVPAACPVAISQQPLGAVVNETSTLTLNVVATGAETIRYQWSRNGAALADGGAVAGSSAATLTVSPASPGAAGSYSVRVWNACGVVQSLVAGVQFFCRADVDQNGQVQPSDVALLVSRWFDSLTNGTLVGDFDGNGAVQPADVAAFVGVWFATVNAGGC